LDEKTGNRVDQITASSIPGFSYQIHEQIKPNQKPISLLDYTFPE
jgi:hypothetical protein